MKRLFAQREKGDGGAAALSLLTVAIIIALAIFILVAVPLTKGSDAKAQSRSAADAAALAGVEWAKEDLGQILSARGWLGSWGDYQPLVGSGQSAAQSFASRNGARLVAYSFDASNWEATVKVDGPNVEGQTPVSGATARLDFPDCSSQESDDPSPTPDDAEDEDPPPPNLELGCDGLDLTLVPVIDGDEIRYELPGKAITGLLDLIDAKLVS